MFTGFLTHDWGVNEDGSQNHERVKAIHKSLSKRGLRFWFDEVQMKGNIQDQMAAGIDNSKVVIVFVTQRYKDKVSGTDNKDNCKLEFQYAQLQNKPMLAVVMENRMKDTSKWKGTFGMILGQHLYFDMTRYLSNDAAIEQGVTQLIAMINKILPEGEQVEASVPAAPSRPAPAAKASTSESSSRAELVNAAKVAEQSERYSKMVSYMKQVAAMQVELSTEERNLFSVAYKNQVGGLRAAWRSCTEAAKASSGSLVQSDLREAEQEVKTACNDVLDTVQRHLIPSAATAESKVFFYKMQGDYCRYIAEVAIGAEKKEASERCLVAYKMAQDIAVTDMGPTHPIRLGLALNFSVFYYEILNSPDRACHMAKEAFDDAISELDTLDEESYKDSTLIMQLLRDNLTLWTSDGDDS
eukprot:CAMPEP_0181316764 /NCGR_PEP_ID=MMETSP1101-20121128/16071_1 /TAXON_ID=46948 /ORGANISM="Rhodomonas abbreviata, Strain Caron Lab Isolate" /LENGTH=411 /DNA_ID=CAMNT_0023424037 /DNA_START=17 /DNA_END=1252 /DNA_ORIENTATION=-